MLAMHWAVGAKEPWYIITPEFSDERACCVCYEVSHWGGGQLRSGRQQAWFRSREGS
jgi:hypothetical protein